jgi:hypothetical protein
MDFEPISPHTAITIDYRIIAQVLEAKAIDCLFVELDRLFFCGNWSPLQSAVEKTHIQVVQM